MSQGSQTRSAARYSAAFQAIHWLTAALMLAVLALGIYCGQQLPGSEPRRSLLEIHKSIGLTILGLSLLRLACRAVIRTPPFPNGMNAAQRLGAGLAHASLYALLFYMPLTGYLFSAAGGYHLGWFGLDIPRLLPLDKPLAVTGERLHDLGQWLVYAVLGLHVAAVVWHQFVKRDGVLARMWPARAAGA
jgi:cytochrome b561